MPPEVALPGNTEMMFWPRLAIGGLDLGLGAVADADHGDDGGHADDDAQGGEDGAQGAAPQRAEGDLDDIDEAHRE
ncbi:MAG: hypothetical protein V9G11_08260 [Bifidobacterium adolescentis]